MQTAEMTAMLDHDEQHWWYRGRRRILRAELDQLSLGPASRLLDAGCGSGRTLDELSPYGQVSGVDLSPLAVEAAKHRGHADVRLSAVEALPFCDSSFDVVTCLDVIEHTPDDRASLAELLRVTVPGGYGLLTVPAYQALWSNHDEVNLHYRRYGRRQLQAAARAAGWDWVRDTHFNTVLLVPAAVVRYATRGREPASTTSDLERTPAFADRLLELPMAAEARWLRGGGRLACGLSLLAVLRRPASRRGTHAA
jgi:SAM-dependent methyltransferase